MTKEQIKREAGKDLWICERKTHLPEHDGATGYFYYVPIEPCHAPISNNAVKALQWLEDLEQSDDEGRDTPYIKYLKGLLK